MHLAFSHDFKPSDTAERLFEMRSEKSPVMATWQDIREKVVEQALEDGDYEALRKISALPGGFGGEAARRKVW